MKTEDKVKKLYDLFSPCYLCPLNCGVKRKEGETGSCSAGNRLKISSYTIYKGEEPPLVGNVGAGAIFFSYCNLKCVYCQNYNFSQLFSGREISIGDLVNIMLELQNKGAANINLITATHFFPQIAEALSIAKSKGLTLPIVYNTSGYESVEVLQLLHGFIDIYLADFRYGTNASGERYSKVPNYVEITKAAVKEMYNQVGNLVVNDNGIAKKGLIVRHLLFPGGIEELRVVVDFVVNSLSKDVYFSLMSQYVPVYRAKEYPEINRKITREEFLLATRVVREAGITNGWIQYG
ncbi:MAG: radical SAM protein [Caldisericota bacterium]|nr:radical SAM protein [Caldisericota bacterium]